MLCFIARTNHIRLIMENASSYAGAFLFGYTKFLANSVVRVCLWIISRLLYGHDSELKERFIQKSSDVRNVFRRTGSSKQYGTQNVVGEIRFDKTRIFFAANMKFQAGPFFKVRSIWLLRKLDSFLKFQSNELDLFVRSADEHPKMRPVPSGWNSLSPSFHRLYESVHHLAVADVQNVLP